MLTVSCPAVAADDPVDEGFDLLREGSQRLLDHLFTQVTPLLDEIEGFVLELDAYEAPIILPNGDILIRRKPPVVAGEGPEIDL